MSEEKAVGGDKPKRKYTRHAPVNTAPKPPAPPDPAVIELKGKIVNLVDQRDTLRTTMLQRQGELAKAQTEFQIATQNVNAIEQDIQYRIGLIRQLTGEAPAVGGQPTLVPHYEGISSSPTVPQHGSPFVEGDGVNRTLAQRTAI